MPDNLCEHCTAACCRYVALPIEEPETRADFEDIRWYLIHENVSVFVEDDEWFISFATPCRHLQPDHRCGIYETRPIICRKYTTENCDYHSGDYGWELHFTSPEHLDAYLRQQRDQPRPAKRSASGKGKEGRARLRGKAKPKLRQRRRDDVEPQTDRAGIPLPLLPG